MSEGSDVRHNIMYNCFSTKTRVNFGGDEVVVIQDIIDENDFHNRIFHFSGNEISHVFLEDCVAPTYYSGVTRW